MTEELWECSVRETYLKNVVLYNLENHDDIQLKMNQFLYKNQKSVGRKCFEVCMNVHY